MTRHFSPAAQPVKRKIQELLLKNRPQTIHAIVHSDLKAPGAMSQFTFQLLRDLAKKELARPVTEQDVPLLNEINNMLEAAPFRFVADRGYQRKRDFKE